MIPQNDEKQKFQSPQVMKPTRLLENYTKA